MEGFVLGGQIDLWFEENGETVLVDYKTDLVEPGMEHLHALRYATQLRLYALALEHKKMGGYPQALELLGRVVQKDPGYCVAYQQEGQVNELAGDLEAARKAYREGIAAAQRKGDHHAKEEMQAALSMLE